MGRLSGTQANVSASSRASSSPLSLSCRGQVRSTIELRALPSNDQGARLRPSEVDWSASCPAAVKLPGSTCMPSLFCRPREGFADVHRWLSLPNVPLACHGRLTTLRRLVKIGLTQLRASVMSRDASAFSIGRGFGDASSLNACSETGALDGMIRLYSGATADPTIPCTVGRTESRRRCSFERLRR